MEKLQNVLFFLVFVFSYLAIERTNFFLKYFPDNFDAPKSAA